MLSSKSIVWLAVATAAGLLIAVGPPTTAPAEIARPMYCNLGPVGRLIATQAERAPTDFAWLTRLSPDQKQRVLADMDTWTLVARYLVVDPPGGSPAFAADPSPSLLAVPTPGATPVGTIDKPGVSAHVTRHADGRLICYGGFNWQTKPGRGVPTGLIGEFTSLPISIAIPCKATDLTASTPTTVTTVPLKVAKADDPFAAIPMTIPAGIVDAICRVEPLARKAFEAGGFDARFFPDPPQVVVSPTGFIAVQDGTMHFDFHVDPITCQMIGDDCRTIGIIRLVVGSNNRPARKFDIGYEATIHTRADQGRRTPTGGDVIWSWPAGPEAATTTTRPAK